MAHNDILDKATHDRVLRMAELKTRLGLSKTTIYGMIDKGVFPAGFLISVRARGWLESAVNAWLESGKAGV